MFPETTASAAPHRPGDGLADGRDPPGLRQGARRIGQGLPLVRSLGDRFALDIEQRHVPQLRYQLLTATAAVLAEADRRSSERAVLIVHEFVTPLTLQEERDRNAVDLDRFLATALDHEGHLAPGDVAGPILVKGAPTLYVGKARSVI